MAVYRRKDTAAYNYWRHTRHCRGLSHQQETENRSAGSIMATSGYISMGNEKLHYLQSGIGKRVLLAFHGYSNNASIFHPFEPHLARQYTILSFDLPHHGNSKWAENVPLTKNDLVTLM